MNKPTQQPTTAWQRWLESPIGRRAHNPRTLGLDARHQHYLERRLWHAFHSGLSAAIDAVQRLGPLSEKEAEGDAATDSEIERLRRYVLLLEANIANPSTVALLGREAAEAEKDCPGDPTV